TLFPYTTLFRSGPAGGQPARIGGQVGGVRLPGALVQGADDACDQRGAAAPEGAREPPRQPAGEQHRRGKQEQLRPGAALQPDQAGQQDGQQQQGPDAAPQQRRREQQQDQVGQGDAGPGRTLHRG